MSYTMQKELPMSERFYIHENIDSKWRNAQVEWYKTGTCSVIKTNATLSVNNLSPSEAEMVKSFLNSCSEDVYKAVLSRLRWLRESGINALLKAPFVEGGITVSHKNPLNLSVVDGVISVAS